MPTDTPHRLTLATAALLVIPPLMWAGNAVVGRMVQGMVPPVTFNFLRWTLALLILLPVASWVLRPGSPLWPHWRRFGVLGLFGVGLYNTMQYLALKTSTPLNVTLVAAATPIWMLLLGWLFYGVGISRQAALGAALSLLGVATVLSRGDLDQLLAVQVVPGDAWMLGASLSWAIYSWLLAKPRPGAEPGAIRADWAAFLLAQIAMGLVWSGAMTTGEWVWLTHTASPTASTASHITWGWPLAAALLFVALGPSLLAYRCWGAGVGRVGPTIAGFFSNLTPLFAAVMSVALLGEMPRLHHAAGFALIVGGIVVSARKG